MAARTSNLGGIQRNWNTRNWNLIPAIPNKFSINLFESLVSFAMSNQKFWLPTSFFSPAIQDVYLVYILKHPELDRGTNSSIIALLVTARNSSPQQRIPIYLLGLAKTTKNIFRMLESPKELKITHWNNVDFFQKIHGSFILLKWWSLDGDVWLMTWMEELRKWGNINQSINRFWTNDQEKLE